MPDNATEDVIAAMTERIVQQFDPLRIILFGSQARGDAGPWSDVDLLVVLPEVTNKREAAVEVRRALVNFTVSKDIIVTTPDEIERRGGLVGTILRPALGEGKVLYERGSVIPHKPNFEGELR
ncbi:MAG: nucleotidyltransferase domain-containing protein [Anaerolineae bacterium]